MRKFLIACLFAVIAVPHALAGVEFVAQTRSDGGGDVTVHAYVSGARAKVVFVDIHAMMAGMGGMVQGMRGTMKINFESPKIEKLLDEDGGTVAGLPTRHYRYRTSYTVKVNMPGARPISTVVEEDIWATQQLADPALKVWLKQEPPTTGDSQVDEMIRAEMAKAEGFPLKRVTVTRTVDALGEHTNRSEMDVLELKRVQVPAKEFLIPRGYVEVQPRRLTDQ